MTITVDDERMYFADVNWHEVGALGEPAFENSWVSFDGGSTYTTPRFRLDSEGWVKLSGLAKSGTLGSAIFTLPVGYRPLRDWFCTSLANNVIGYVKVAAATGAVTVSSPGGGTNAFVSLDNAYFPSWQSHSEFEGKYNIIAQASANWQARTDADIEFQTGIFKRKSGMYQIGGIHAVSTGASAGLPLLHMQPNWSYIFAAADNSGTAKRLDIQSRGGLVTPTTTTTFTINHGEYGLFDLEDEWIDLTYQNSWVDFGIDANMTHVKPAGYWKDSDGFVHVRGMVKSGSSATAVIATLPAAYRPVKRQAFTCFSSTGLCRIDVKDNGEISAAAGGSTTWTSFSGICFYADN